MLFWSAAADSSRVSAASRPRPFASAAIATASRGGAEIPATAWAASSSLAASLFNVPAREAKCAPRTPADAAATALARDPRARDSSLAIRGSGPGSTTGVLMTFVRPPLELAVASTTMSTVAISVTAMPAISLLGILAA